MTSGSAELLRPIICPSLLSCDLANLERDGREMLERCGADWLHMDIMDGHFVPNLSFGPPVIASLHQAIPGAYLDCHLMVSEPSKWIQPLAKAGASSCTFHVESTLPNNSVQEMIQLIRQHKMKVGIVIKPKTSVESILEYIEQVDLVLIMTVEPGFSGQAFMPEMMSKVQVLRTKFPDLIIQVDGGLAPSTVDEATRVGANAIVAASAIFSQPTVEQRKQVVETLRNSVLRHAINNSKST